MHDSYGRKSNTRFLLNYGFINLNNDANDLPLKLELNIEDPLFGDKIKALNGYRWRNYNFMGDYEENITAKIISFLRYIEFKGSSAQLASLVTDC